MLLVSEWVCRVVSSGYHNGSPCSPRDPHDSDWDCGWRFRIDLVASGPNQVISITREVDPGWAMIMKVPGQIPWMFGYIQGVYGTQEELPKYAHNHD